MNLTIKENRQKNLRQKSLFTFLASELRLRISGNNEIDVADFVFLKKREELLEFAGNHLPHSSELSPDALWRIVQENKKYFLPFTSKTEQNYQVGQSTEQFFSIIQPVSPL